ncbi:hypothetical protein [Ferrimonas marina]|nr:hypothetical protein [Ferrimonas marina]
MNKTSLALVISAALLAGCSDDSSDEASAPQSRLVEASTLIPEISEMNPQVKPAEEQPQLPGVGQLIEVRDSKGYAHFIREDGYVIDVKDSVDGFGGDYQLTGVSLSDTLSLEVMGAAEVVLSHPEAVETSETNFKYYTVATKPGEPLEIDREDQKVTIEADNHHYAFVTVNATDDFLLMETKVNEVGMMGIRDKCTLRKPEDCRDELAPVGPQQLQQEQTQSPYLYAYVTADSVFQITDIHGYFEDHPVPFLARGHYDFGTPVSDPDSGRIIIGDPGFDPIELQPGVMPVLEPAQLSGLDLLGHDTSTGAVTVRGSDEEAYAYPLSNHFDGTTFLRDYQAAFSVTALHLEDTSVMKEVVVNIYLNKEGKEKQFNWYLTGEHAGAITDHAIDSPANPQFTSFEGLAKEYGDWQLSNRWDGTQRKTNFIVRFGDSGNNATGSSWRIEQAWVAVKPVVDADQVFGASLIAHEASSGKVRYVIDQADFQGLYQADIYPNMAFDGTKALSSISPNVDIDAKEAHVSIYLLDQDGHQFRCDWYMAGKQEVDSVWCGGKGSFASYEAFKREFGANTLDGNFDLPGRPKDTNFIVRIGVTQTEKHEFSVAAFELLDASTQP